MARRAMDLEAPPDFTEWVAIWRGRIVARGPDLAQVAIEACRHAPEAVLERLPQMPAWEPHAPPWA